MLIFISFIIMYLTKRFLKTYDFHLTDHQGIFGIYCMNYDILPYTTLITMNYNFLASRRGSLIISTQIYYTFNRFMLSCKRI